MVKSEFAVECLQIRTLGLKHLIPFLARLAGVEAFLGHVPTRIERDSFAGLDEQVCRAHDYEFAKIAPAWPGIFLPMASFEAGDRFLHFQPVASGAAQRRIHSAEQRPG